jgi:hypothetical protein
MKGVHLTRFMIFFFKEERERERGAWVYKKIIIHGIACCAISLRELQL